jgi:membrane fusion protein (multidrug efflux system)
MTSNFTKISLVILSIALIAGCKEDKQAKLVELKKEQQVINESIITLEKELAATTDQKESGVLVTTKAIQPAAFTHYIEVQGKLDGEDNIDIHIKAQGGVVQQVLVKLGDPVKKGQVIAILDDTAYRMQLEQMQSQYNLANEMYERQARLWEQKIGSEVQYLQAKTQKEAAESGLAAIKDQVDNMKIKSPISGNIESLPLKVGMAVSPAYPVATVVNFASTKVVANIAESYGSNIKTGDSVTISFPDIRKEVKSTISTASNLIDARNRSFSVEIRLTEKQPDFKANMIAVLRIVDYTNPQALAVPINLIQTDSKGNYVFVANAENGKQVARKKYIEQGRSYNGIVEITGGLTAGDKVITVGHLGLNEGAVITL